MFYFRTFVCYASNYFYLTTFFKRIQFKKKKKIVLAREIVRIGFSIKFAVRKQLIKLEMIFY